MFTSGADTRRSQVMVPIYLDFTRQDIHIPFVQKSGSKHQNVQPDNSPLLMIK